MQVQSPVEKFWSKVREKRAELERDALAGKLGPAAIVTAGRVEGLWIASLEKEVDVVEYEDANGTLLRDWKAGVAVMVPVRLAAQRILERSHRLATKEEIDGNLKHQREEKERNDAADRGLSQRHTQKVVQLPREV